MRDPYIRLRAEQSPITYPGTGTISTNALWIPGTKLDVDPQFIYEDRNDEIGPTGPRPGYVSGADPKWALPLRAYPDPMGLFLFGWAGAITTTAGDGIIKNPDNVAIPVGAYRHKYGGSATEPATPVEGVGPDYKAGITPQTLICDWADDDGSGPWWLTTGLAVEEIKLGGDAGALTCDVSGKALYHKRQTADPTLTPAYAAATVLPWNAGEITLTWLGGTGTIEDFSLTLSQPLEIKVPPVGSNPSYWPSLVRLTDRRTITGTIKFSDIDTTDYDAFVNSTSFAAVAKYTTASYITGTTPYQMWIDMPECVLTGMKPGALENTVSREMEFDFQAFYDTTDTFDAKITLVNGQTAYNTGI